MPKILVIGETWGAKEAEAKAPFVGPAGKLLKGALRDVGIPLHEVYFTNVLNLQPRPTNDIVNCCGPRAEGIPGLPALAPAKYLRAEFAPEIERLMLEIRTFDPNLIITLGNTPLAILTHAPGKITKNRGTITLSEHCRRRDGAHIKILPTYHPSAIHRDMAMRPIFLRDLMKAARHWQNPEFKRPSRELWLEPDLNDLARFYTEHLQPYINEPWGIDIETKLGTITEIGFARPHIGIVIPFYSRTRSDGNYWPSKLAESSAWGTVKYWLSILRKPIFQNGLYDINYLWRTMGITLQYESHDTMLLAHAQQPEMKKGLGFLASLFTDEPSWKFMRKDAENTTLKREDD